MATVRISQEAAGATVRNAGRLFDRHLPGMVDTIDDVAREAGYRNAHDLALQAFWSGIPDNARETIAYLYSTELQAKLEELKLSSLIRATESSTLGLKVPADDGTPAALVTVFVRPEAGKKLPYISGTKVEPGSPHYDTLKAAYAVHTAHFAKRAKITRAVRDILSARTSWGEVARDWPVLMGLCPDDVVARLGNTKARRSTYVPPTDDVAEVMDMVATELLMANMLPAFNGHNALSDRHIFRLRSY